MLTIIQDQRRGILRYDYDELGRLTKTVHGEVEERFAFDPAGKIIDPLTGQQKKDVQHSADAPQAMQTEIEVSAQLRQVMDDLVKDYMGAKYQYDAQGNVTYRYLNKQHLKLTWNALNQLQSSEVDGIRTDYIYDVFGRRIAKRSHFVHASFEVNQSIDLKQQQAELEQQGKLGLTLFGWQGEQLAWESYLGYRNSVLHTGLTAKTTHYIYEPDTVIPVAQVSYASAMRLLPSPDYALLIEQGYDRDKDPFWTHDPIQARPIINSVAYYHCDHLGTPQEMRDQEGELLWSAHYKAWGEAKVQRSERAKHLRIDNYHRYQGQYYDNETGLHYNRFRYYDPHLARYISRDPIGLNGGMNLNAYVPNPNQWVDSLGLSGKFGIYENDVYVGLEYTNTDKTDFNTGKRIYVPYTDDIKRMNEIAKEKGRDIRSNLPPSLSSNNKTEDYKYGSIPNNNYKILDDKGAIGYTSNVSKAQDYQKTGYTVISGSDDAKEKLNPPTLGEIKAAQEQETARRRALQKASAEKQAKEIIAQKIAETHLEKQRRCVGTCESKIVDYITCSTGFGGAVSGGVAINLHNGQVFTTLSSSGTSVPVAVEKSLKAPNLSINDLPKFLASNILTKNASCTGGHVINKNSRILHEYQINEFLTGKSRTFSVEVRGVKGAVTVPDGQDFFDPKGLKGIELGKGGKGISADISTGMGYDSNKTI